MNNNLYVYSDESGVFSKKNKIFLFSGFIFIDKNNKDNCSRVFFDIENKYKKNKKISNELKGTNISLKKKEKIIKYLSKFGYPFLIVIHIEKVFDIIFESKKSKQRYLDYVYKVGLKRILEYMDSKKIIDIINIENLHIYQDEHTTATNSIYELRESILQEYKHRIYYNNPTIFHNPISPNLKLVSVKYCDSSKNKLIRLSDICSNYCYAKITKNNFKIPNDLNNFFIIIKNSDLSKKNK